MSSPPMVTKSEEVEPIAIENFFQQIRSNNLSLIQKLVEAYPDYLICRTCDEWAYTPIHWSSQSGLEKVTKYLVEALKKHYESEFMLHINAVSARGNWTAISLAANYGYTSIVKIFLSVHARVDLPTTVGNFCIHSAAFNGHTDTCKVLLEDSPVHLNSQNPKNKFTALMMACQEGKIETVKYLLYEKKADLLIRNDNGSSGLYWAFKRGHLEILDILLKELYKMEEAGEEEASYLILDLFYEVVQSNDMYMFRKLVDKNPKLVKTYQANEWRYLAIHWSCQLNFTEMTEAILDVFNQKFSDELPQFINSVTPKGHWTPLTLAANYSSVEPLKLLLKYKEKGRLRIDLPIEGGSLATHLAALAGATEIVRALLREYPTYVNHQNTENGFTALMFAAQEGYYDTALVLIKEFNCDLTIKNRDRNDALQIATNRGHTNIVNLLTNPAAVPYFGPIATTPISTLLGTTSTTLPVSKPFVEEEKKLKKDGASYTFLVYHEDKKKKLKANDIASIEDLIDFVAEKLKITQQFSLEYYDKDCEEFIDLDSLDDLESEVVVHKISVKVKQGSGNTNNFTTGSSGNGSGLNSNVDSPNSLLLTGYSPNTSPSFITGVSNIPKKPENINDSVASQSIWNERYRPKDRIGTGGFGRVYSADVLSHGFVTGEVAIKLIQVFSATDFNSSMKEAVNMLQLRHENIVPVTDVFELSFTNERYLCIVMPLFKCGDLFSLIRHYGEAMKPIPEDVIYSITEQTISCLDYIHSQNIVHRDIKPGNILIKEFEPVSGKIVVALADFGLSKSTNYSTLHTIAGTSHYQAPEILMNENYSLKSDVYSLGVVLYQLLSNDVVTSIFAQYIKGVEYVRTLLTGNVYKIQPAKSKKIKFLVDTMLEMIAMSDIERPDAKTLLKKVKSGSFSILSSLFGK
ncbi:hypothetical protein ABK040_002089 [Willaertia magna]